MTLWEQTLAALNASENGALADMAIREQVGSMRAVPHLEKAGLVTVHTVTDWIERSANDDRMEIREHVVVRLVEVG